MIQKDKNCYTGKELKDQKAESMAVIGPDCSFGESFFFFTKSTENIEVELEFNSTSGPGDFGEVKYDKYVFDKSDMRDLFNADQNFLKLEKPCLKEYQNRLMHNKHAIFKSICKY